MKLLLQDISALIALLLALDGTPTWAECTSPPSGSPSASTTRDNVYNSLWCNDSTFNTQWNGLHLDVDNWDEGYGMIEQGEDQFFTNCAPNDFLTRLMNGAVVVREVQKYAIPFGEHRQVSGFPGGNDPDYGPFDYGYWWAFPTTVEEDEWEPECETDSNATNHPGPPDEYIGLKIPGAYKKTAMYRAAIIAHEPTHADVSHIGDDTCSQGSSCDDKYGHYNANTMHVNFLYDAASTYQMQLYNAVPVRPVQMNAGTCSYIPRFTANEREEARAKSENDLDARFESATPAGTVRYSSVADIDAKKNAIFPCQQCDLNQWVFAPSTCTQTACNEVLNPDNHSVNVLNKIACNVFNSKVGDDFVTPDVVAAAKEDYEDDLQPCLAPAEADVLAYCEAEKASASDAGEVDECGWLDNVYLPSMSKLVCVQQFCQQKWNESGGWTATQDPYGCLDYLCGGADGSCGDADDEATCKAEFVAAHGNPDFYATQCESDGCKRTLIDCLFASSWSYGDPIPSDCQFNYDLCVLASKLAAKVWIEFVPFEDPGPPVESYRDPLALNPAINFHRYVNEFRAAVARGASERELDQLALGLTRAPEMVAALYRVSPAHFVGMFGTDRLAEILGPAAARKTGRAFSPEELTPAGQSALADLQRLLSTAPGGQVKAAIGTLKQ